jgi:ATP-dependent RNA helicase DHX37/DHR1
MPPFVPRQRKHRVRQRLAHNDRKTEPTINSNAIEILPASKKEEEEKRNTLKAKLSDEKQKISSKKQKRLDKYIVSIQL